MALQSCPVQRHRSLSVAIIGGGIGGLSAAVALRRSGHTVTVYEKNDFAGEVGASVSCAANGTRWLEEWAVDIEKGDPVTLKRLINRDWKTGNPVSEYSLADYRKRWGYEYYMFHRQYMHAMLKECALQDDGGGVPVVLRVNHACQHIDFETTTIVFQNGETATHELIIGADGIGSVVRKLMGVHPAKRPAEQQCLHANVMTEKVVNLGLVDYSQNAALEYWGGQQGNWDKIVLSPCNGGKLLSYYCFFPRDKGDYTNQSWGAEDRPVEELLAPYPELDSQVKKHLEIGIEVRPWRLWVHEPYPYLQKGNVCLLGDAGHPMMPHQSQGACMAIEDAGALGVIFNRQYFTGSVHDALHVYEKIRLPRVTRVQAAAAKAAYNINERIGFSANKSNCETYQVENEREILTIEEMNAYDMYKHVEQVLAEARGETYKDSWINGLPKGLEMPNGVIVGQP